MATFEGFELLGNFSKIFTFLFVFAVTYGVLELTNLFKNNKKTLNPLISISLAVMVLFSEGISGIIEFTAPWFVILMISLVFIGLFLRFLGIESEQFTAFFRSDSSDRSTIIYWVLVLVGVIVLLGVGQEYGQSVGPYLDDQSNNTVSDSGTGSTSTTKIGDTTVTTGDTATGDFSTNLGATIFHPKIIGAIIILIFASFTVRQIAKT